MSFTMAFRQLDSEEEASFRRWARENHQPGGRINDLWHPAVRAECLLIDKEAKPVKRHWHVHSHLGGGYLCECDSHYPFDAKGRDRALREERDSWRDYAADSPTHIRISGSIRSGHFTIDDTDSIAWVRYVDAWSCYEAECSQEG